MGGAASALRKLKRNYKGAIPVLKMAAAALYGGDVMVRFREALLLVVVAGFAWYLFVAPQQGAGSFDSRAKQSLEHGQMALETAAKGLFQN